MPKYTNPLSMLDLNKRFFANHVITPKKKYSRKGKRYLKNDKRRGTRKNKRSYSRKYKN